MRRGRGIGRGKRLSALFFLGLKGKTGAGQSCSSRGMPGSFVRACACAYGQEVILWAFFASPRVRGANPREATRLSAGGILRLGRKKGWRVFTERVQAWTSFAP